MDSRVRKSLPTRVAALGFIFMILLGNYWMVLVITNQPFPQWLMDLFLVNAFLILMSAVGVVYVSVRSQLEGPQDEGNDED